MYIYMYDEFTEKDRVSLQEPSSSLLLACIGRVGI